ncbi:MAG: hypothetical protein GW778_09265 [Alphaproteobacteria bacterium]|nr:hypothetical protein [Alphaproteobacteria bacterium]
MSNTTMEDLKPGMCRWPIGHPEDKGFHFCGGPSDPSLPYCNEHMIKAQAPVRKSKTS